MTTSNNKKAATFNVTFGTIGRNQVPANSAVLVNECRKRIDGKFQSVVEFMAISGVKSTKTTDLLMPVLAVMLADARKRGDFECEFKVAVVNGKEIETKLRAKSAYTKWLNGDVVYKSNSEGKLNKALALANGQRLRNTSLKVTVSQPIYTAKDAELTALMFKTASAVAKQATMYTDILCEAKSLFDAAYATPVEEKKAEKPKAKKAKQAKKAENTKAA